MRPEDGPGHLACPAGGTGQGLRLWTTQVGPGTPLGRLLRSHWHPIAAASELRASSVKAVRLLGEDLVLYRASDGGYGLLGRHCPHRLADLSYGWTEGSALRCMYHGWLFDRDGRCLEQPYEDAHASNSRFRDRARTTAYAAEARAGLVWAYLGQRPVPLLPDPGITGQPDDTAEIMITCLSRNWLAHHDSVLPVADGNGEFSPAGDGRYLLRKAGTAAPFGIWPHALCYADRLEWTVPVDDFSMLSVAWKPPADFRPGAFPAPGQAQADARCSRHRLLVEDLERMRRGEDPRGVLRNPAAVIRTGEEGLCLD